MFLGLKFIQGNLPTPLKSADDKEGPKKDPITMLLCRSLRQVHVDVYVALVLRKQYCVFPLPVISRGWLSTGEIPQNELRALLKCTCLGSILRDSYSLGLR